VQGVQGVAGDKGDKGDKGDPGPTSAGVGGNNLTVSPSGTPVPTLSDAGVTLQQPGRVLVLVTGTASVTCGGSPCSRVIGATLDGTKVQGLVQSVDGPANATTNENVSAVGIVSNVPVGAHSVEITSTNVAGSNDLRVVAVALG
jgi:hypothetical protein